MDKSNTKVLKKYNQIEINDYLGMNEALNAIYHDQVSLYNALLINQKLEDNLEVRIWNNCAFLVAQRIENYEETGYF